MLYESASELVLLERWAPGIGIAVPISAGIELLVLDGGFTEGGEEFTQHSWLRLPAGSTLRAAAGRQGCRLWVKSGHLSEEPRSPAPSKRYRAIVPGTTWRTTLPICSMQIVTSGLDAVRSWRADGRFLSSTGCRIL